MGFFEVNKMALKVTNSGGFDLSNFTNVKETPLLYDDNTLNVPTFYFNSGYDGIVFEISIVMKESYFFNGERCSYWLDAWDKFNTPVTVVTDAIDVPNGKYTCHIKSKKQTKHKFSIWKLRFKQYYENNGSFETMFTRKMATLSAIDQMLLKYTTINENSPREAILALQQKLQQKGCWTNTAKEKRNGVYYDVIEKTPDGPEYKKRVSNGEWDVLMQVDIFEFQHSSGLGDNKNGVCDLETIQALTGDTYEFTGVYYQRAETYGPWR